MTVAVLLDVAAIALIFAAFNFSSQQKPQVEAAVPQLSANQIYAQYLSKCADQNCVFNTIRKITDDFGVAKTFDALVMFQQKGQNQNTGDPHLWAHEVGSEMVRRYGVSGKTLLMCPETFNYGCQHGFFEAASVKSDSIGALANRLCGAIEKDPQYSYKHKFYCYHGAGHGIMQNYNYDLSKVLSVCDSMSSQMGVQGCWQGAFMEGDSAAVEGTAPAGVYSDPAHPLAPCDKVAAKYQDQCYINLPGALIYIEKANVAAASNACLGAGIVDNIKSCMDGLGIVIANDRWQDLTGHYPKNDYVNTTWKICSQDFPADYVDRCIFGAVAQIINMDQNNTTRAVEFCNAADKNMQDWCYHSLGNDLSAQAPTRTQVEKECNALPKEYIESCRAGGQLENG